MQYGINPNLRCKYHNTIIAFQKPIAQELFEIDLVEIKNNNQLYLIYNNGLI
jgi:hypothetical protein